MTILSKLGIIYYGLNSGRSILGGIFTKGIKDMKITFKDDQTEQDLEFSIDTGCLIMKNEDYYFEFSDSQGLIAYLNYLYEDIKGEPVPPLKELL